MIGGAEPFTTVVIISQLAHLGYGVFPPLQFLLAGLGSIWLAQMSATVSCALTAMGCVWVCRLMELGEAMPHLAQEVEQQVKAQEQQYKDDL